MTPRDAGSAILVVVHFQKKAFNASTKVWDDEDFDPSPTPKVTVTKDGAATTPPVSDVDMIKSDAGVTGYWHYVLQTVETWTDGLYKVKATGTDGTNSDVKIEHILELKNSTA